MFDPGVLDRGFPVVDGPVLRLPRLSWSFLAAGTLPDSTPRGHDSSGSPTPSSNFQQPRRPEARSQPTGPNAEGGYEVLMVEERLRPPSE